MNKCVRCRLDYDDHIPDTSEEALGFMRCPVDHVETCYGYFTGGDPRLFHPDRECCTPEEIEAHRRACEQADAKELNGDECKLPCPSGWEQWGDQVVHVTRSPFGIGTGTVAFAQYYAATQEEADEQDEQRHGGLDDDE